MWGYELVQALDVPVLLMVEQHVEVVSFLRSSLPAVPEQVIEVFSPPFYFFEQNADIPVPRGRGARGGRSSRFSPRTVFSRVFPGADR